MACIKNLGFIWVLGIAGGVKSLLLHHISLKGFSEQLCLGGHRYEAAGVFLRELPGTSGVARDRGALRRLDRRPRLGGAGAVTHR